MAAKRERALRLIGRAPDDEDTTGADRLEAVPEAFVAGELARLESAAEERLAALSDRLREEFEAASQDIVERAGALVFEQVRRADAAELERTRVAKAGLQGLGDEVERVREAAMRSLEGSISDSEARQARFEEAQGELRQRFEEDLTRRIEASLSEHANEAASSMAERASELGRTTAARLGWLEAKTSARIEAELAAVRDASDAEVRALAERAGLLVYARIRNADSRVEEAVQALARDVDSMRSALRAAATVAERGAPADALDTRGAPLHAADAPADAPAPRRWRLLRRTLRRAA